MKTQTSLMIVLMALVLSLLSLCVLSPAASSHGRTVRGSVPMMKNIAPALAAQNKTVKLTIIVKDQEQKAVAGAQVDITHDAYGPEFRAYDYRLLTDANGVASTDIEIGTKWGEGSLYWPSVDIEATKDLQRGQGRVRFTGNWYRNPKTGEWGLEKGRAGSKFVGPDYRPETCTIVMNAIDSMGVNLVSVKVHVESDNGDPADGATVLISGSTVSEHFQGVTDSNGDTIIPVPVLLSKTYNIEASKLHYKSKKTTIGLTEKQYGKLVTPPTVTISKVRGAEVTISVRDKDDPNLPVREANVILNGPGYYSKKTDGSGNVTLFVEETGTFTVAISQDNYEPFSGGEVRVAGEEPIPVPAFALKAKFKKERGDTIEVTVLKKDPSDPNSKPVPAEGALVTAQGSGRTTDGSGRVTITGFYDVLQEVIVEAEGYQTKSQSVPIDKGGFQARGTGHATFILVPDLSESRPIRLTVEVRDAAEPHKLLSNAYAYLWLNNQQIATVKAPDGEATFVVGDSGDAPLAKLRDGLKLVAKAPKYKLHDSAITADLLKPSLETKRATIYLERDWDELRRAVETLEPKVKAWQYDQVAGTNEATDKLIDKQEQAYNAIEKLAGQILDSVEDFGVDPDNPLSTSGPCRAAAPKLLKIRTIETQVNQKAQEFTKTLDDAVNESKTCSSFAQAESIKSSYRKAFQLFLDMNKLREDAAKNHKDLVEQANLSLEMKKRLKDLQAKLAEISKQSELLDENARNLTNQKADGSQTLAGRQIALKRELAALLVGVDAESEVPPDLTQRINVVRAVLAKNITLPQKEAPVNIITSADHNIAFYKSEAERLVAKFFHSMCTVNTLDEVVTDISTKVKNAGLEMELASNLPDRADACAGQVAKNANKAKTSETTDNKTDEKVSSNGPAKEQKPPAVEEDSEIKIDKPSKPSTQDTSSGGFWEAAKAGKKKVENTVNNKPAQPTSNTSTAGETSENKRGTNTATTKTGNNPNNPPPTVEEIPDDRAGTNSATTATANKTNKPPLTVEAIPETYVDNPPLSNRPPPKSGNRPPVVEEIPDTAANKPAPRTGNKPPVVEEIPDTASTNVASNRPRANSPQVEEIPDTSTNNPKSTGGAGGNWPNSPGASGNSKAKEKPKKENKPRDPNQESIWTALGRATREAITGQPSPGVANNPAPNTNPGGGGGGQRLNLAGTWNVTTQSTGDEELQGNWTRTNVWQIWDLGGGRWRVRQVINGQTYDENYSTVDEGGGRFRLIGSNPDGSSYQMSGTYSQSQFGVSTGGGQSRVTISGTRQ
jgi:hypothetical protein